jgi:hypothetical protein
LARLPRAQQSATPVIGYLSGGPPGPFAPFAAPFREGLKVAGYVEVMSQSNAAGPRRYSERVD